MRVTLSLKLDMVSYCEKLKNLTGGVSLKRER